MRSSFEDRRPWRKIEGYVSSFRHTVCSLISSRSCPRTFGGGNGITKNLDYICVYEIITYQKMKGLE